jgi:nucleotide-binding universal stress UspA family protein
MLPKINTILYCTSLGPHAPYVFGYACVLAGRLGAKIVALHVVEGLNKKQKALVDGYAGEGRLGELISEAHSRAADRLPQHMRATLSEVTGEESWDELVKEVIIAEGRTTRQILRHVESRDADMVVIGAHTESSMIDRMIGSTARSLVKNSPVPVLTVQVPSGFPDTP